MSAQATPVETLKQWAEFAPENAEGPSPVVAWENDQNQVVCEPCMARIESRGCSSIGWIAVWKRPARRCEICNTWLAKGPTLKKSGEVE
jgi:hypothetical protein